MGSFPFVLSSARRKARGVAFSPLWIRPIHLRMRSLVKSSRPRNAFARDSQYVILFGFGLVLALMIALAVIGLTRMEAINRRMEVIAQERNVKTELVTNLRTLARERALTVLAISLMDDPFERDVALLRFRELAADFIKARDELRAMKLNPFETATLDESARLTRASTQMLEEVVDLIGDGRMAQAQQLLVNQAIPMQNRVFSQFNEMLDIQRQSTREAVEGAARAYSYAYQMMVLLGLMAVALGAGVAFLVVRRTARTDNALFREKERAEVTLHSIGDAVITTDAEGKVDHLNEVASELTGWRMEEARGLPLRNIFNLVYEATHEPVQDPASRCLHEGSVFTLGAGCLLIGRDGNEFAVEESVAPIRDHEGRIIGVVVVFRDVTKSRSMAQQMSWQATHDPLTGLANRREFESRLTELVEGARQQAQRHVLLYIDLDQFKVVNDTCGHVAGDELLRQLAALLQVKVRENDTVARLGGDEFGVLLAHCSIKRGRGVAEMLRQLITDFRFVWEDKTFEVGASIGLVEISQATDSVASILSAADAACYVAKDQGRNRVWVHQPDNAEVIQRHGEMQWVSRISKAFEEDRFRLHYQNIRSIQVRSEDPIYCEILLRMVDETGLLIPPMAFIPAAERYNLMPAIDRWVVRSMFQWIAKQTEKAGERRLYAINLSGQTLGDDSFVAFVVEQFEKSGISPRLICFEITETAAIANLARAMSFMSVLKGMGCRFSLDDFGSGMSSFAYLKNLPVDSIKIDGAFVRDIITDEVDMAMVEAINRIGQVMGIQTVAEFVENDAILARLKDLGVDYAQGYGVHKPECLPGHES